MHSCTPTCHAACHTIDTKSCHDSALVATTCTFPLSISYPRLPVAPSHAPFRAKLHSSTLSQPPRPRASRLALLLEAICVLSTTWYVDNVFDQGLS